MWCIHKEMSHYIHILNLCLPSRRFLVSCVCVCVFFPFHMNESVQKAHSITIKGVLVWITVCHEWWLFLPLCSVWLNIVAFYWNETVSLCSVSALNEKGPFPLSLHPDSFRSISPHPVRHLRERNHFALGVFLCSVFRFLMWPLMPLLHGK